MTRRYRKPSLLDRWPLVFVGLAGVAVLWRVTHIFGVYAEPVVLATMYVAFVTWFFGRLSGYVTAIAVSVIVVGFIPLNYNEKAPLAGIIWEIVARIIVTLGIAYIIAQLRAALDRERMHARIDQLTGVNNRFSFEEKADAAVRRAKRRRQALTVAFIDCDNFKEINDRYGHEAGDELLQCIGQTLQASVRPTDVVARIGGDEFAVIFHDCVGGCPHAAVRRLRNVLRDELKSHGVDVTLSIGVATFNSFKGSYKDLLRVADRLQYNAKATGKNAVIYGIVEDPTPPKTRISQGGAA